MSFLDITYYSVENSNGSFGWSVSIPALIIGILTIVAWWRLFQMADEPGWLALIPIVNAIVFFRIVYGSGWYMLFLFIPLVDVIFILITPFKLAGAYGRGMLFGLGLLLAEPIFIMILAFDSVTQYYGVQ